MRPVRPAVRRRAHGRPCPTRRCQAVHKVSGGCMQALARLHRPGSHTSAAQHTTLSAALRTRAGCGSGAASSCTRKRHEPHAASRFAPTRGSRAPPTGRPRLRARRPAPCLCGGPGAGSRAAPARMRRQVLRGQRARQVLKVLGALGLQRVQVQICSKQVLGRLQVCILHQPAPRAARGTEGLWARDWAVGRCLTALCVRSREPKCMHACSLLC